eukprot:UN02733
MILFQVQNEITDERLFSTKITNVTFFLLYEVLH